MGDEVCLVQWSFVQSTSGSRVESRLHPACVQCGICGTLDLGWTLSICGWLDVAVFHMWHLERHRTTTTIRHPELLPSNQVVAEGDCLAGVGTGWFGATPHTKFADSSADRGVVLGQL